MKSKLFLGIQGFICEGVDNKTKYKNLKYFRSNTLHD